MPSMLPWMLALLSLALALGAGGLFLVRKKARDARALPAEWALTARPVFNSHERQLYRLLRLALPQHIILAKLPLVRLCQPTDPRTVRYWFGLLGNCHVSFAICSNSGRVLAVVDIEGSRAPARRVVTIKQSVLNTCGIRYLSCTAKRMPSVPELQQLLPASGAAAPDPLAPTEVQGSRQQGQTLWRDSGSTQESWLGMDGRGDGARGSSPGFGLTLPGDSSAGADEAGGAPAGTRAAPLRH